MYLLDTNHCSYIINNSPSVIAALRSRSANEIGISIITYGELLYMTEKSERKAQNLVAVQAFLASVDLYFIDEETAILYSQLKTAVFNQSRILVDVQRSLLPCLGVGDGFTVEVEV